MIFFDFFKKVVFFFARRVKITKNPLGEKSAKKFKKMRKRYCNNR